MAKTENRRKESLSYGDNIAVVWYGLSTAHLPQQPQTR